VMVLFRALEMKLACSANATGRDGWPHTFTSRDSGGL
jgi:hypothetical protein